MYGGKFEYKERVSDIKTSLQDSVEAFEDFGLYNGAGYIDEYLKVVEIQTRMLRRAIKAQTKQEDE